MNFGWLENLLFGLTMGLSELLPVSVQAHSKILLKFMGRGEAARTVDLFIHLGILAALYLSCQNHILKMVRAKKMSRIPKKKRKRPLDTKSLMDLRLLCTMMVPVAGSLVAMYWLREYTLNMVITASLLFLSGLILYIPQFLPSSNKDCRSLSPVEGLLMGLGGCLFVIPGLSGLGAALSIASVAGVDRKYGLGMILLMQMGVVAGKIFYDLLGILSAGLGELSLVIIAQYLLAGLAGFLGAALAIRILRMLAQNKGYGLFAYYNWGLALFAFVLSLMA